MNKVFHFGDTLDNITLTAKDNDFCKNFSTSNTETSKVIIGKNEQEESPVPHSGKNIQDDIFNANLNLQFSNISVDDSIFLRDFTLPCTQLANASLSSQKSESKPKSDLNTSKERKCDNNDCLLTSWGLPAAILEKYKRRNIEKMFSWQVNCLSNEKVIQNNCNLIYSAPTSAGKTLVAEILAIKTVIERHKKVLFILPFVSVVREKMFYFQDILGTSGVRVEGFMGSYNPPGGYQSVQVAVCTIEKANSIINRMLEEGNLADIGTVIVDEIHLLGDPNRGYLLELMLTKLQYMSLCTENNRIQIIGMSATLPNLDLLGKWLKAEIYTTDFRPIPLHEQLLLGNDIYNKNLQLERTILSLPEFESDLDHILYLSLETIQNSCSVLIFCPTKNWCENLSQQIAVAFWKLGCSKSPFGHILREQLNANLIRELLEQLKQCPSGLDKLLEKTISYGVAFHHAGLTMDERDIIESAFRNTVLRVLVATSTLSSGVNLPARRVIIRTPLFHGKPLDNLVYHQMIGRAGRMGRDTCGESILISTKTNCEIAKELVSAELKPIKSCLDGSGIFKRALLEVVASGVVKTPNDVALFSNCTLFAASEDSDKDLLDNPVAEAIEFLCTNEFIRLQELEDGNSNYMPTALGKACLSSSMSPEEGLSIFLELQQARQCFVLENELHLIYMVTPYSTCNQWSSMDWMLYLELWEKLSTSMKRVGDLVGIREAYIISATRKKILTNTSKLYRKLQIHKRFFTALALQDLVNEIPITDVAIKFGCSRGMLQSLQQSASTFAGMLTIFSRHLGWTSMEILIAQFQDRLQFGISRDLLDLMRLSMLTGPRARMLYNAGIETLAHLAGSDIVLIENLLLKAGPFESSKEREGESDYDAAKRNRIKSVWITGKEGLTAREAAIMLLQEARRYLKLELGLVDAKWEQSDVKGNIEMHESEPQLPATLLVQNCNTLNRTFEASNNEVVQLSESPNYESQVNVSYKSQSENINLKCNSLDEKITILPTSNILETSDQSLFDASFEQEINLNSINTKLNEQIMPEIDFTYKRNSDSGLEFDNVSFLENAFVSSDDQKQMTSPITENVNTQPASDLIDCSQSVFDSIICFKDLSSSTSTKRFSSSLHTKHGEVSYKNSTPTKKRKLLSPDQGERNLIEEANYLNKSSDVCNNLTQLQIVDVCSNRKLYETFSIELHAQKVISLSFACRKHVVNKTPIGNNVVGINFNNSDGDRRCFKQFIHKDILIIGIAFSWGTNISYYCSFLNEEHILNNEKIKLLRELFLKNTLKVRVFDCKEQIKLAKLGCGLNFEAIAEDPKVADWLLDPDGKEKNLQAMTLTYAPEALNLLHLVGHCKGVGSIGLDLCSTIEPKIRATVESIVGWHLSNRIFNAVLKENSKLIQTYRIEMKSLLCITRMELNGIKIDVNQLHNLVDVLNKESENIQKQTFFLAGKRFSFTSSIEVAKVLGLNRGSKPSTSKQSLQRHDHPIANLILQWRKLNGTLTKMIYPLIRLVENDKIHGCCVIHTSTGRISMHEPNLQNIPRDFHVNISKTSTSISCRSVFIASENFMFLSADYCQLELRILAHLCQDPTLCSIMKTNRDVFKMIAAHWKNMNENEVDDELRQWTKQICYGIIYGMGTKALAEHLLVSQDEAKIFMESFKKQYPNIQLYIQETIKKCKDSGYIETYAGRRRYLPQINSENTTLSAQAERQAVNTTIQGSAADIAKLAITLIEGRFQHKYRHSKNLPRLVLNLHDELLYEVHDKYLLKTAKILKEAMEEVIGLTVPLPVKLKSGKCWGTMSELML